MASTSRTSTTTNPSTSTSNESFLRYEPPARRRAPVVEHPNFALPKILRGNFKSLPIFYRGPDVRKTLVDHLFQALSAAGLNVFLDTEKLEKGKIIDSSLERAIESSAIRIPIFSKGYADSVWRLREAAAMLRTPGLIIPLFYHVAPTHVRYPEKGSSPYKHAFQKHRGHSDRYEKEEIDGWNNALLKICERSGWSMDIADGFEARMIKTVVNDLIRTLDKVSLEVATHPVGLDSVKNALIQKLNLNSVDNVIKIGIWGISGIGKTTVAKAVYNQIFGDFEAASFVSSVRTVAAEATGLTKLQKKVLKDLAKYDREVDSVDEGITLLRERLGGKRVLIILDDMGADNQFDAVKQLNALDGDWLACGSRVIITSRDQHILNVAGVSKECIHEMAGLEIKESLELFSWRAFLSTSPSPNYEDLSKKIVEACKGHPLSLEVIGSSLYGRDDRGCWEEALHIITHNSDIYKRLYISYSTLNNEEKEIFVDIACFFIGEDKTLPIVFWKSLYENVHTAISNLSMKLLIKIDDRGFFDMHDHLRDMGRIIAEKEKKGTRKWEPTHLSTVSKDLSRLRLIGGNPQSLEMLYKEGLRYLHLQDLTIRCRTEDTLYKLLQSLIWLSVENCSFEVGMNRAVSHFRIVENNWQYKIVQLKRCFNSHLISIPKLLDIIGNLSQLQTLELEGCGSLSSILDSIGNLSQLQKLSLRGCGSLSNLPDCIGNLSQLQTLELDGCGSLRSLRDSIGNLSQLQILNLQGCRSLSSLPDCIGNLSQLHTLNLRDCMSLSSLPDAIGNLLQLQHLDLCWCCLSGLPDSIGNLSQLQKLELGYCQILSSLPGSFGNLSQLHQLDLSSCRSLSSLPDRIGNLSQLQMLNLYTCASLSSLPDSIGNLSQLQKLYLDWCESLSSLPDSIGNLSQLQMLNLPSCKSLRSLPDSIGNLSQLQKLDLGWCVNLRSLPDSIGNLSQLRRLQLHGCESLRSLPDSIGNLLQLREVDLEECKSLSSLPDSIGNLSQLQWLNLGECKSLTGLPDRIGNLSQLEYLNLKCESLSSLPDCIGNLLRLQQLDLEGCGSLRSLPDSIGNLSQLQWLNLGECKSLRGLPDRIGNLSQLEYLKLKCESLSSLPHSIGNLLQLQQLDLEGCGSLRSLPDNIGNLTQLHTLNLRDCMRLKNLPGSIANLSQLHLTR